MWAEIKNVWNHALFGCYKNLSLFNCNIDKVKGKSSGLSMHLSCRWPEIEYTLTILNFKDIT